MSEITYVKWANLAPVEVSPLIQRRLISGDNMTSVEFTFKAGAVVPLHSHPHEQISHILTGKVEFEIAGQKRVLGAGEAVLVPSNVVHGVVALEDAIEIEVFSPPRADFLPQA